jgi:hypothetical protein
VKLASVIALLLAAFAVDIRSPKIIEEISTATGTYT